MSLTIFLNHAWQDKDLVVFKVIERKLRGDGYSVWIDKREIEFGEEITPRLDEAIAASDLVLSLWSKNALASKDCRHEIAMALRAGKLLVPCRLDEHDPTEYPDFRDRRYFDFRDPTEFALLQLTQFLVRLRNRRSALFRSDTGLQDQIRALNDALVEVEDSVYRWRTGVSGNRASASYIQSMLEAGKKLVVSSMATSTEEQTRLTEFMCRVQEIAFDHPGPEDDDLKKLEMRNAIDAIDPQCQSPWLQSLRQALDSVAPPADAGPATGARPILDPTGADNAMNDPLRSHIESVRRRAHTAAALRQRLGEVLGAPDHPQLAQCEQALNGAIDAIPQILEQVSLAAQQAGIAHLLAPMLQQVTQYFLHDDDLIPESQGTLGLLDDAYLAHAFLYQVNVAYQANTGRALLPFDPGPTIQVLRAILGPRITTQLDQAVVQGVNQAVQQSYYEQLTQWNQTLAGGGRTGGPGSWGGSWEDEMARVGAEIGISFD